MRVVFMGSPKEVIAPLEILLENQKSGDFQIVGVVSQPARPSGRKRVLTDPPVAAFAKDKGLEVLQPEKASDKDFLAQLKALDVDLIITAAYGQMLSDDFLAIPKRATINIHPSLLPEYRGATPVQSALLDGKVETGVSVLFTVKKMDAGALIEVQKYRVDQNERADTLLETLFKTGGAICVSAIEKLKDSSFTGVEQDPDAVTFCRKLNKEDGLFNFSKTAEQLHNEHRAYFPWPGSYGFLEGERVVFEQVRREPEDASSLAPGEFVLTDAALNVGTKKGSLLITQLKPAGSKSMDAKAFYNRVKSKGLSLRFDLPKEGEL